MAPDIHSILKQYWGYNAFRPLQEDVVRSVMTGNDTLALMPTGGGKSVCYQVPAMAMEGMCLVISPLIALMKDQVEGLRRRNITAYAIYSGMGRREVINTLKVVTESNCKFLYVSPERLETSLFKEYLPGMDIRLLAIDEAHCISQWGYDFRPPYLRIAALRNELPGVPVLALTASATPDVQLDICERLTAPVTGLVYRLHKDTPAQPPGNWKVFRQSFERPNLSYSVFRTGTRITRITDILANVPGTAIIYCKSRRRTKEISDLLKLQGIAADYYHAGLLQEERSNRQEAWIQGHTRVIVCTNAFGMGIDKPDVRVVIHADVPDCLENYYQEAGRAGRDGKKSYAVLLYDERDIKGLETAATQRFPSLKDIRAVYQAIANYLQLHTGDAEGNYYDFDMTDFARKFNFSPHTALYALKSLEQDGWLAFNEQALLPSRLSFTVTKDVLYEFERSEPALEPLIKTLLRTYEGIFDQAVPVSEKLLAQLQRLDEKEIMARLHKLHSRGIVEYSPRKDTPQLYFLRSRVKAGELVIDMAALEKRKERFEKRVQQMLAYVNGETGCRSRFIGRYFGDDAIGDCGICDNCLRLRRSAIGKEEFERIHLRILEAITSRPLHTRDLLQQLTGISREHVLKVIGFLETEQQISIDADGRVHPGK